MGQDMVKDHQFPGDQGSTRLPAVPVVFLAEEAVQRAGMEMVQMATVRPNREANRELTRLSAGIA